MEETKNEKNLKDKTNENLEEKAKRIQAETLIIWGDQDEAVPVSEAERLEELIPNSAKIILPGTHYCYLENLSRVISILKSFI